MLVSLAITMIMMGAVVSLFGIISDSVSGSRSIIEMSERLRAARNRLQTDLQGATADMRPPLRPEADQGYLELIEGPDTDLNHATTVQSVFGDADDVLMFTTRSRSEPFVGKLNGTATVESQTAEVAYFCVQNGPLLDGTTRLWTLYRRLLVVSPGLSTSGVFNPTPTSDYYRQNDVSIRLSQGAAGDILVPNTLGDLTKRENRFAHYGAFPFNLNAQAPVTVGGYTPTSYPTLDAYLLPFFAGNPPGTNASPRYGDDILLANVLAFDVQVFDPAVPLRSVSSNVVSPPDPGYTTGTPLTYVLGGNTYTNVGGYVDLGTPYIKGTNTFDPTAEFNGPTGAVGAAWRTVAPSGTVYLLPRPPSSFLQPIATDPPPMPVVPPPYAAYDTWSLHYENNGIDEDDGGTGLRDEGTDGIDNDTSGVGLGLVDDVGDGTPANPGERETQAPFAAPLRGIKITIRVYEPSSKQVRQVTVVQDFLAD